MLTAVPTAIETLERVLRGGRKVGVYLFASSQDMLTRTLGTGGAIREAFRTAIYSGGDIHSAATLLALSRRDLQQVEGQLSQGVVLLRSAVTQPAQMVRVPQVDSAGVAAMLGVPREAVGAAVDDTCTVISPTHPPDVARSSTVIGTAARPSQRQRTAEEQRIVDLFTQGQDVPAIVTAIYGFNSKQGAKYQKARATVERVLREALTSRVAKR